MPGNPPPDVPLPVYGEDLTTLVGRMVGSVDLEDEMVVAQVVTGLGDEMRTAMAALGRSGSPGVEDAGSGTNAPIPIDSRRRRPH